MEVNRKNREELKKYFVKNAIPTESNFKDFIDGVLNQKDDGLIGPAGDDPLSIVAVGVNDNQKKVLNFYSNFSDPKPSWVLSLNPRTDPSKPETAKPGFGISDGEGNNRLFIDRSTGNIGIGTSAPGEFKLNIKGSVFLDAFTSEDKDEWPRLVWHRDIDSGWDEGLIKHGSARGMFKKAGFGVHFDKKREFGLWSTDWNPLFAVDGETGNAYLKGNVGIGTNSAAGKLQVAGPDMVLSSLDVRGQVDSDKLINTLKMGANVDGSYGAGIQALQPKGCWSDGVRLDLCTQRSSNANELTPRLSITAFSGNVGIGTVDPGAYKLNVSGNIYSSGLVLERSEEKKPRQLLVNRGVLNFSNEPNDWNHAIYNNGFNVNGDGNWDGMIMNVFDGLDIRTEGSKKELTKFKIDRSGNVGIGTANPQMTLHLVQKAIHSGIRLDEVNQTGQPTRRYFQIAYEGQGNIHFYHETGNGQWMDPTGNWHYNSDLSLKEKIAPLNDILKKVMQLNPVSFSWRNIHASDIGFIAQDVEKIFPELVSSTTANGSETKGLAYSSFGVLAIKAIQEMKNYYDQKLSLLEKQLLVFQTAQHTDQP